MRFAGLVALCLAATAYARPFTATARPKVVTEALRLIETAPEERNWMTEAQINELRIKNVGFMDVTDYRELDFTPLVNFVEVEAIPASPRFPSVVRSFLPSLSAANMKENLTKFSSFFNRYYKSSYGTQSAQWLFDTLTEMTKGYQKFDAQGNLRPGSVSVSKFAHTWNQFSIIVRIEGATNKPDTVILGAHQDSINQSNPNNGKAPGADDDGTGSVTNMEILRTLLAGKFVPELPLEFHFYSGEEAGLLGSQAVARQYYDTGRVVKGMLQIDMGGYVKPNTTPEFGIVTDFTDANLNAFIRKLAATYTTTRVQDTKCGYGCSDHASFTKLGYPASFPFEARFENDSPYIHSDKDTVDRVDFDHVLEFARLGLAFAVEMSYSA